MKNPWLVIGMVVVVLIGGSVWYSNQVSKSYNEGVVLTEHIKGNPNATVTLTEYSDFECPACKQFEPIVLEVLAQYGDGIKFEYKHFPLIQIHPYAEPAAWVAEAAGQQGKFFEFQELLFENQEDWAPPNPAPSKYFSQYAEELGLDMSQFNRHVRSSIIKDKVRAEYNTARDLGLTSTPTFFLNGQKMNITTYQDFIEQVKNAVDPKIDLNASAEIIKALAGEEETKNIASTSN